MKDAQLASLWVLSLPVADSNTGPRVVRSYKVSMRTLLAPQTLQTGPISLFDSEAHHGRSVLRLSAGDSVQLTDGQGRVGVARVVKVTRHQLDCELEVVEQRPAPAAFPLTVALAPPKGSRLEDVVRSLTELGVGVIAMLGCERVSRMPGLDRARRVAIEAVKQCGSGHVPELQMTSVQTLSAPGSGDLVLLDPEGHAATCGVPRPVTLVIGPEGGLTADERAGLQAVGAAAVRLAGPILRIETAACAAAAVWAHAWEHHGTD